MGTFRAPEPGEPPEVPGPPPDWTDLAPYADTGRLNQYSPMGEVVQSTNFVKGLLRNRHWYNRAIGWLTIALGLGLLLLAMLVGAVHAFG